MRGFVQQPLDPLGFAIPVCIQGMALLRALTRETGE